MESGKMALPAAQLGRWLMAFAERLRTDLFFVVTQLRNRSVWCFCSSHPTLLSLRYNTVFGGECAGASHLLWAFAARKVREFVTVLENKAPLLAEGEELGAVMEQCMLEKCFVFHFFLVVIIVIIIILFASSGIAAAVSVELEWTFVCWRIQYLRERFWLFTSRD